LADERASTIPPSETAPDQPTVVLWYLVSRCDTRSVTAIRPMASPGEPSQGRLLASAARAPHHARWRPLPRRRNHSPDGVCRRAQPGSPPSANRARAPPCQVAATDGDAQHQRRVRLDAFPAGRSSSHPTLSGTCNMCRHYPSSCLTHAGSANVPPSATER
jgi:hypothetical protein